MLNFLELLFFTIGFIISFGAVGYGIMCLVEQIQKVAKKRDERFNKLIETLDRIEARLRQS